MAAVVDGTDGVAGFVEGTREPVVAGGVLGEPVGDLYHAARVSDVPFVGGQLQVVDARDEGGTLHHHGRTLGGLARTSATIRASGPARDDVAHGPRPGSRAQM